MNDTILELLREYASDWQAEKITGGYKLTKDELSIRFLEIESKYGDYHARILFYKGKGRAIYAQRTNISSDRQREQDLQWFDGYKEYVPAIDALRHALHKEKDKAQEEVEETLEVFNGSQSLDLKNWPVETEREVVAGFAVKRGYTHLFGDAGVGKSLLAHNIGLHAASDQRYLGFLAFLPPIKVLYLSLEMSDPEFRERHNKLLTSFPKIAQENFIFTCPNSFDITTQRDRFLLSNTVKEYGIKLVIVDSHSDWRGSVDTNDNGEVGSKIILPVQDMMKELDFSLILLDHTGWQGERPSGAKVVWNRASIGILMEADKSGENLSKISFRKWRNTARKRPRPIDLKYNLETYLITQSAEADLLDIPTALGLSEKVGKKPGDVTRGIMELMNIQERWAKEKKSTLLKMGVLVKRGNMIYKTKPVDDM